MRKFHFTITLLLALFFISACSKPDTHDIHGKAVNLADFHGKWLIVNYWATWCKPCLKEMPDLNKFYLQHKNRDAVVLGVNYDHLNEQKILLFTHKLGITYPMLQSFPLAKYNIKEISVLPTTYIINPQGKLTATLIGPQSIADLTKQIT